MQPEEAKKRMTLLSETLDSAAKAYYQTGTSPFDDAQYDLLSEELADLERQFPEFALRESVLTRVGAAADFAPTAHRTKMYSLENCYQQEELLKWYVEVKKTLEEDFQLPEPPLFVAELKIDGLALSLTYARGRLVQAVTRGDGSVGDLVTSNVKSIENLPHKLPEPLDLELRGEVYLPLSRFEKLQQDLERAGQDGFMNARNAAAGSMRLKDPQEVKKRGLACWVYDQAGEENPQSHQSNLEKLERLGLPINPHRLVSSSFAEIFAFCQTWEEGRKSLDYDIDGVVIKLNDPLIRSRLGFTAKFPRWAKAWKFKGERVASRLKEVEDSIGRTGALTPVARIEPVLLHGTWVKRASLHNYMQVELLDLRLGDRVWVEKGGEIIPKIVGVDLHAREGTPPKLTPPSRCPSCGEPLIHLEQEVNLRCLNLQCPAQQQARLEHFVSRKALDIEGLGPKQIALFLRQGWVLSPADLYRLGQRAEELKGLEGFGEKSVQKLLRALERSKKAELNRFIFALGIRHVGEKLAKTLALEAGSLDGFLSLDAARLGQIAEVDKAVTGSVLGWLGEAANLRLLADLKALGLAPKRVTKPQEAPFSGKNIVITGTLSLPRGEWKYRLEQAGFNVTADISAKTHFLLAGEKAGSKLKRAEKLGVPVLDEAAITQLLAEKVL